MALDLTGPLLEFLSSYGLVALIVILFLDSSMLLPLVPGELMLVVGTRQLATDHPSLVVAILAATIGTTLGSLALYGIARGGGRRFIERHPRLFLMSPERRDRLERTFRRPLGQLLVFFFRLFPFLRIVVSLPAGLAKMPWVRFTVLTFLGNLVFNAAVMGVTFESQRPGSPVAATLQRVQVEYLEPAYLFLRIHWLITAAVIVLWGFFAIVRNYVRAARRPEKKPSGSLVGRLAVITLVGGGITLAAGLWVEPQLVFDLLDATRWNYAAASATVPGGPLVLVALMAGMMVLLGLLLAAIQRRSKEFQPPPAPAPASNGPP